MKYTEVPRNTIGIYKITSPSNRVYIGQSKDIYKRWRSYQNNISNSKKQSKLYNSFLSHGIENHKFEIIHECEIEDLNRLERYYQELYNCIDEGLNLVFQECDDAERKLSKETSEKKRRLMTGENNPMYGKRLSDEAIEKLRKANLGKKYSDEVNAKKGRKGELSYWFGKKLPEHMVRNLITHRSNKVFVRLENGEEHYFECVRDCADFFGCTTKNILFRNKRRKQGITPSFGMFKGVYLEILEDE